MNQTLQKNKTKSKKKRNYSFRKSSRLSHDKMTEIDGIKIPAMPGTCYHGILCSLAINHNKFCTWERIFLMTEKYMIQYGGQKAWDKFVGKSDVKAYQQRIRDNTHTLTRTGRNAYGYRLHELGMAIYYFKDGAMLLVGGKRTVSGNKYQVTFKNGCQLQSRYRGSALTYKEYKTFLNLKYIDESCTILKYDSIKEARAKKGEEIKNYDKNTLLKTDNTLIQVCIKLDESYDQHTANRLESLGLVVEEIVRNEIIGMIRADCVSLVKEDIDVQSVTVQEI